jgi:hypothetical protein
MTIYWSPKMMRSRYTIQEDGYELSLSRLFRTLYIIPVYQFAHSIDFNDFDRWRTMQRRIRTNDSRNISLWGNRRIHLKSRPSENVFSQHSESQKIFLYLLNSTEIVQAHWIKPGCNDRIISDLRVWYSTLYTSACSFISSIMSNIFFESTLRYKMWQFRWVTRTSRSLFILSIYSFTELCMKHHLNIIPNAKHGTQRRMNLFNQKILPIIFLSVNDQ